MHGRLRPVTGGTVEVVIRPRPVNKSEHILGDEHTYRLDEYDEVDRFRRCVPEPEVVHLDLHATLLDAENTSTGSVAVRLPFTWNHTRTCEAAQS